MTTMAEVVPTPAAALIVAREGAGQGDGNGEGEGAGEGHRAREGECTGAGGPEFLLLKRSASARFMPNAYVFPGGAVDADDATESAYSACAGLDDEVACRALGVQQGALRYFIAAVRETFEECGLLYAYAQEDLLVGPEAAPAAPGRAHHAASVVAWCASSGWRIAVDRLFYVGHWITPRGLPRRFDTRFFLAQAPPGQRAALVSDEMQELVWLGAREALQRHAAGRLLLMMPTVVLLEEMAPFQSLATLLDYARSPRVIRAVMPDV